MSLPEFETQTMLNRDQTKSVCQIPGRDETLLGKLINGYREPHPEVCEKVANFLETDESRPFERTTVSRGHN